MICHCNECDSDYCSRAFCFVKIDCFLCPLALRFAKCTYPISIVLFAGKLGAKSNFQVEAIVISLFP